MHQNQVTAVKGDIAVKIKRKQPNIVLARVVPPKYLYRGHNNDSLGAAVLV